jgi:hypothetical protein
VVVHRFDNLHTSSQDILRGDGNVRDNALMSHLVHLMKGLTYKMAIDATNAASTAEKHLKRIQEMLELSSAMRVNVGVVEQLREYARWWFVSPLH